MVPSSPNSGVTQCNVPWCLDSSQGRPPPRGVLVCPVCGVQSSLCPRSPCSQVGGGRRPRALRSAVAWSSRLCLELSDPTLLWLNSAPCPPLLCPRRVTTGQTSVAGLEISYWCTLLRQTGKVRQCPGRGPWSLSQPLGRAGPTALGGSERGPGARGHCAESPPWGRDQPSQGAPSAVKGSGDPKGPQRRQRGSCERRT